MVGLIIIAIVIYIIKRRNKTKEKKKEKKKKKNKKKGKVHLLTLSSETMLGSYWWIHRPRNTRHIKYWLIKEYFGYAKTERKKQGTRT